MNEIILHLGTNKGNRLQNLKFAQLLIHQQIGLIVNESKVYETAAWGLKDQDDFLNKAISVTSSLSPHDLLEEIHKIEQKIGRVRLMKWGPRVIDIDIIFYGQEIVEKADLKIPHTELTNRNFVLVPLMDICPSFVHPILKQTVKEIYTECKDQEAVSIFR